MYRIGPAMLAVVEFVARNPGLPMAACAAYVGPHGSLRHGYRTVHRAIRAGLVRAVRTVGNRADLYPVD